MSPGFAQTSSIKQGFDAAWARQPEQHSAALRRDVATAKVAAAGRWTPEPPSLEVSAKSDRFTRNEGVREYEVGVAIPLWLPGERSSAHASAASDASAFDARLLASQWRLAAEVREAYWTYQRASSEQQLAERRLANARQLAADVSRRVRAGDLARSDSHQAEGTAAAAEAALAEATMSRSQAGAVWKALTGQKEPAVEPSFTSESRPAEALADAVHPVLRDLSAKADAARAQRELAGVQTRSNPELTIGAVRERDGLGERYGQSVVVGLRVPLGRSSSSEPKLAAANAELVEAESQLTLEVERIRAQVDAARAALGSLEVVRKTAERRASLALESRGFFEKSFRLGESDLPTRLRAELEAFEAERQAARSRLDVGAAISRLRQALGLLPD
jgi:cobalt-zinc-cadmium efflux system outer membrane protein